MTRLFGLSRRADERRRCRPVVEELEPRRVLSSNTIAWDGGNWFLAGVNYPWNDYAADFGNGGWGHLANYAAVKSDMQTLAGEGVHLARWWVFGDGRYDPLFNAKGQVTGLDSQFFSDLDTELQYAANNHIYLDLTLLDFQITSSAQFVNGVQLGGHAAIITDPATRQSYINNALVPLLQHIAASPYRSAVLDYDIINEPEYEMTGFGGGANIAPSVMKSFVQNCVTAIHTYGGGAYATVGSATPYWVNTWEGLGLDFYAIHYYPWMDFNNGAGSGLPSYASLGLDKPAIIEEFSTSDSSYGLNDTTPLSAEWYMNSIYNLGYAGELGWSYDAGDSESNWASFQPVYSAWVQAHAAVAGPQPPSANSPNAVYVGNLYNLLLHRAADAGASYWIGLLNQGVAPSNVVTAIESSSEYLGTVVTGIYQHYLSRTPDAGGLNYWVGVLQSGTTVEQVIQGFISSPEFYQVQGHGTNSGFVTVFYQDVLNRAPDTTGFNYWLNALNTGAITPAGMAYGFLHSWEYDSDLVTVDYQLLLRRSVDGGGLNYWTQKLQAGLTDQVLLATLLGSPEGYADWS